MNDDISNIFEKLNINKDNISPEMIDNIMGMLNNNSNNSDSGSQKSGNNSPDIDIENILKMKSILEKLNNQKTDSRSMLLQSLRPYLKESRRSKLDQYIQMSKLIEILPLLGGEFNNGNKWFFL